MGRALVVEGPGQIALEPRDDPSADRGEMLIRPTVVGLCGTDLEIIDGRIDPAYVHYPIVIGHEWTGVVVHDPSGERAHGTPVVVEGIVPCGKCVRCRSGDTNLCETYDELGFTRDGAAADAVVVPAALVHHLAPDVDHGDAALVEPCAVVHRALSRAAPEPGGRVLVVGDGTVALLTAHLSGLWSPEEVVILGLRPEQRDLAEAVGASRFTVDPVEAGAGFDLVVEAAGTGAAALAAIAGARRGGTVVLLGLPSHGETVSVAFDDVVNADLSLLGSFSYTSSAWRDVVGLVNAGSLTPGRVVTHRFPLEAWATAIETLRGGDGPRGKVLLTVGTP